MELSARYRTQQEALLDALHGARKGAKRGEVVEVFLEGQILPIAFNQFT
jgi:hypothetical protein